MKSTFALRSKFLKEFMLSDDPEGQEIVDLSERIDMKWRTFCKHKHLVKEMYPMMKRYLDSVLRDYLEMKKKNSVAEAATTVLDKMQAETETKK
jgi:hypothetical protein